MTTEFPKTVCELGMPGPMRDRLVQGVLSGKKTATSSLLIEWEQDGDQLPEVGDRSTVIDSSGVPVAILELTQIDVLRLEEVGPDVALAEGEGFTDVAAWRLAHERFWNKYSLPELRVGLIDLLEDDTLVVVEHFRMIFSVYE